MRCTPARSIRRERLGQHVADHDADHAADERVDGARRVEAGILGADRREDRRRQRLLLEVGERKQAGPQPVLQIVAIIGDVVGDRGGLRLQAGKGCELQVLASWIGADRVGQPPAACGRSPPAASTSGPLCLTSPSSVSQLRLSPSKAG